MSTKLTSATDRRTFLKQATGAMIAAGMSARSYARVIGANDRIRIAQLGCGHRSSGHVHMVQLASKQTAVETMAVCDIWGLAREARAAQVKKAFGLEPQTYKYSEEMLSNRDIDGVMIATGDFQHAKLCAQVVQAGKDCYVEKPFANVLSEAKEARSIVKASKQMVQMGTQHRSEPYPLAVSDIVHSHRIGDIVHIEQEWNVNEERWRRAELVSKLREEDTDWKRWLLDKPYRQFDPRIYVEFRLFKDYSSGLFDQWMCHGCDLVHLWTDETYPESVVANGGIFTWKDDRETADTCVAAVTYPKGFLYTFKAMFGNSYRSFSRIQGRDGTIVNYGGENASLYVVSREGGQDSGSLNYAQVPLVAPAKEAEEVVKVAGAPPPDSRGPDDDSVVHLMNWLNSMRSRVTPNANVDHGFSHSIASIMAAQSYWSGKKLYWNPETEEIVDQPLATINSPNPRKVN